MAATLPLPAPIPSLSDLQNLSNMNSISNMPPFTLYQPESPATRRHNPLNDVEDALALWCAGPGEHRRTRETCCVPYR